MKERDKTPIIEKQVLSLFPELKDKEANQKICSQKFARLYTGGIGQSFLVPPNSAPEVFVSPQYADLVFSFLVYANGLLVNDTDILVCAARRPCPGRRERSWETGKKRSDCMPKCHVVVAQEPCSQCTSTMSCSSISPHLKNHRHADHRHKKR